MKLNGITLEKIGRESVETHNGEVERTVYRNPLFDSFYIIADGSLKRVYRRRGYYDIYPENSMPTIYFSKTSLQPFIVWLDGEEWWTRVVLCDGKLYASLGHYRVSPLSDYQITNIQYLKGEKV